MAGYSARQSSFTTGDTILAAHSNDEFNQVLAAFHATTGHSHDGTAGEGGPVSTLRDADALNKILVDTTNNHLEFYVEVSSAAVQQLRIQDGAIVPITDNDIDLGTSSLEFKDLYVDGTAHVDAINFNGTAITSTAAELNILDGVTATATELNIIDGDTTATSTTVADADRVVLNDGGTMKQVAVTDLAAYFDDEITAMPNLTSVGTLTTLTVDNVIVNGTTIGHTDDTDLITLANGVATVAGEISVTTLDIGGTNVTSTAAELNILDGVTSTAAELNILDGVTSTATELNILDGDTSATSTTVADADRVVLNDGGTMKQVAVTDLAAYFDDEITAMSNLVTTGALNSGSISSGFGNIDIGSSNLTATGTISLGAASFNDNAITNVGDIALDSISADATDINIAVSDNSATALTIKQGSDAYLIVDTANSSESVSIGTGISGTAITLGHSTSEVTVADNLTVTGDLTVSGTTTTVNSTTVNLNDHNIVLDSGNSTSAVVNGGGITLEGGSGDDATFTYNTTGPKFELKLGSSHEDLQVDQLIAASLDISGNVDVDGTLETDALSINSTTVTSTAAELNILDGVTATATEINLIDGGSSAGTTAVADADGIITNDGGTMRLTTAATFKTYFQEGISSAADDISAGDAAVNLTTTSGNITIDAQAGDSDIIFKGTDDASDITALTLDMSAAGEAIFNAGIVIADAGNIGSASDKDAIAIASNGVVTFSQAPVFPDGSIAVADLDIDGATDIGADIVDADLFIVDDGAGGTNRKVAASRIKTYIGGGTSWQAVKTSNFTASAGQGVFCNTSGGAFTLTLPASPSIGDEVSFIDYAGTFDTNNLTIGRNSSKILGAEADLTVAVERAANTLVFTDSTQGWLFKSK